ncbi:hypothetical protein U3516DRAFT_813328 [Neocallimastix sp. 'constans']
MTGILPIAKQLSQSTLNFFTEYSILEDDKYYQYFGFTGKEVKELCKINSKLKYKEIYTGRVDEIFQMINFDINGIKKEIIKLIKGNEITINLEKFGTDELLNEETNNTNNENNDAMKEGIYSKMVTFGYLTYYKGKLLIPNNELKERFIKALKKRKDMKFYYDLITNSRKMLKMTLRKNTEEMCKILEEEHMNTIKPGDKMDHELKLNKSAEIAIKQIHEKVYYYNLKDKKYSGKILLIGINCEAATKKYTCKK